MHLPPLISPPQSPTSSGYGSASYACEMPDRYKCRLYRAYRFLLKDPGEGACHGNSTDLFCGVIAGEERMSAHFNSLELVDVPVH